MDRRGPGRPHTGLLLLNAALPEPQAWAIYAVGAVLSAAGTLQRPSREALVPRTVRHDELPAAVSVSSLGMQVGLLGGPALGGILVESVGAAAAYAIDVTGLMIATALFARLGSLLPSQDATPASLRSIAEGARYAVSRRDLLDTYVIDIVGDVPRHADGALPCAGQRCPGFEYARTALYGRHRGQHAGHRELRAGLVACIATGLRSSSRPQCGALRSRRPA